MQYIYYVSVFIVTQVHSGSTCIILLQIGRLLVRSQMVSLEFFIDIILPIALWPSGRLSL